MDGYVTLASDGTPVEPDGSLVAGGDANDWYRLYCELYDARTVIDRHALARLEQGFRDLLDDGTLTPLGYVGKHRLAEGGREVADPRAEQLNDMVDRYEGLVGRFLADIGIEVERG